MAVQESGLEETPDSDTMDESEETLSLCDLPLYSDQSGNEDQDISIPSYQQDYFEFFTQQHNPSSAAATAAFLPENIIFCGKLIPRKQQAPCEVEIKTQTTKENKKKRGWRLFKWMFSYRRSSKRKGQVLPDNGTKSTTTHTHKMYNTKKRGKGVRRNRMSVFAAPASPGKAKWYLLSFGISTGIDLKNIKSRQSRPSPPLFGFQNHNDERYCFFHIHSEDSFETCGPRRGITDVARLFIVRYERYATDEKTDTKKQTNNVLHAWYHTEADPVSTLVAKYNGSSDVSEIIQWISQTIKDGDSREIPPFKTKAPELLPEDAGQSWSQNSKNFISSGESISSFVSRLSDYHSDPRIGPMLLLLALMSSGYIWLNKSRSTQSTNQNESTQLKDENKQSRIRRRGSRANQLIPPSITDLEPKDAQQIPFSDSDSE